MIKKLLLILSFLPFFASAQTIPLSFTALSANTTFGPGRGAEQWNHAPWDGSSGVNSPAGNSTPGPNYYTRFTWNDLENENSQGVYIWTEFDRRIKQAFDAHQVFSFAIMPLCSGCTGTLIGSTQTDRIPTYVHNLMQAETPQDWFYAPDGKWIPNWNSPSYIARYTALLNAVANHIATTSYKPAWSSVTIPYSKIIYQVDIRGYGNYGEWHTSPWVDGGFPTNLRPNSATLHTLIDANLNAFPNYQNMALIGALTNTSSSFVPVDVTYYILTVTNNYGRMGWRRDNWGDPQYSSFLENNSETYNPGTGTVNIKDLIMNQYKFGPISGEPNHSSGDLAGCGTAYCDLLPEVNRYHAAGIGNGNFGTFSNTQTDYNNAMVASGYNVKITTGTVTANPVAGGPFNISLNWQNTGLAPPYQSWNVQYELRTAANVVVWTGTSSKVLKLFLPSGSPTLQSDNFTLAGVSPGTYNLYIIIRDPNGYMLPFPLGITGRLSDGSYSLTTGLVVTSSGTVTANAGSNQTITSPTSSVTLDGSGSLGTITSYLWTRISGPNTPTITTPTAISTTITGLITGTYVFQLSVNGGASTDQVTITVNPPPVLADAGPNQTITLPTSSVTLTAAASIGATSYSWTRISGPSVPTIVSPTSVTTNVTPLIQGTYVFQVSINGGASTDQVTITVNPAAAPVANAGPDQTIYLPSTSTTLDGTGSTGSISSYLWARISGPNTPTIANAAAATTALTGLIQGTYVYQLSLNGGASTDQVTIVVNPAIVYQGAFTGQIPTGPTLNDGSPIELGAKFRSTSPGYISGVQFYKKGPNTGTHIGQLYNASGTLLASATFINETATGWQQVLFTTPVAILANTTYVCAYFSPTGYYEDTDNGLIAPITNGGLSILADGTDGVNGVYNYSATPVFPTTGGGAVNYWVDFMFSANIAPTARITGPTIVAFPTTSITLNGSTSGDPDGSIQAYQWSRVSGPNTPTIVSPVGSSTNITGLIPGVYVYQLMVTDNLGATGTTTFSFTVTRGPASFTIGTGSGTISIINMGTYIAGDTIKITAGTYTSITLTGLNGLLIIPATSTPTFGSGIFCNWNHMIVSGMNFVSTGAVIGIDATCGIIDSSTIKNISFTGYSTSCINASGGFAYSNGVNSTLKWNLVTIDSVSIFHCGKFIQGSTGVQPINNTDVMWKVSLTHITEVASTATINEGIGFTGVCYDCLAQDVASTSTTYRPATGETGWIMGAGWWHIIRMYRWGAPGYLVHIYTMSEYRDQGDNWITQSGKFNSTQYGLANYQTFFTDTVAGIRTGTNAYIFNNTLGDQGNDASGVGSPIAMNGAIVPGKHYYVKNNFGFAIGENNNNSGKQRIAVNLGGWTSIASDTSNNQYFPTATIAKVDSTTIGFSNALGGFTYYLKTGVSPATLFHSGVTNPLISTDYFLKAMRVPPDLGYDQFYGVIPGQEGFNGWIRHGRKNKFVNRN